MRTTVTSRRQTVVPAKIRRAHTIQAETPLDWIDDGRTIGVVPIPGDPMSAAIGSTTGLGEKLLDERRRACNRE